MKELTLPKKKNLRIASKVVKAPEPPKEKTLEEVYLEWHAEQLASMKDSLDSAFGDNYDLIKHEFSLGDFVRIGKGTTAENKAIISRLLDIHEYEGMIGQMRNRKAYTIIVHFPALVVSDGGRQHPIKDMWTKIEISAAFCSSNARGGGTYFQGTRTTLNYAEITSNYAFSHLSGGWRPDNFRDFCLGHTPFAFLCTDLVNSWDKDKFLAFCFQLQDYLSWESLDGGPYSHIRNIQERDQGGGRSISVGRGDYDRYYRRLLALPDKIPVTFVKTLTFCGLRVKGGEEFDLLCTEVVDNPDHLSIWDPVTKTKTNRFVTNKAETIQLLRREYARRTMLTYKGQAIKFIVTDEVDAVNEDVPTRASDQIVSNLMQTLNNRLLKETTNEYR